jgi:hypothetical protein
MKFELELTELEVTLLKDLHRLLNEDTSYHTIPWDQFLVLEGLVKSISSQAETPRPGPSVTYSSLDWLQNDTPCQTCGHKMSMHAMHASKLCTEESCRCDCFETKKSY